jgi:hypothetical protein
MLFILFVLRDSPPRAQETISPRSIVSSSTNTPIEDDRLSVSSNASSSRASWRSSSGGEGGGGGGGPPKPARLFHEAASSPLSTATTSPATAGVVGAYRRADDNTMMTPSPNGGTMPSYRTTAVISAGRLNGISSNSSSFSGLAFF